MIEEWRDIKGYEGLYQVSNHGNVKRIEHIDTHCRQGSRVIKEYKKKASHDGKGYLFVILSKENKKVARRVHRLVAETFIDNPNNYPQVNHKDENKENNTVDNLEWCDAHYNINYGDANKRRSKTVKQWWMNRMGDSE